jgi:hypothetical protein
MFLLVLSTLPFLYIPQFPAHYREYVVEIYELEYHYHAPVLFSFFFIILLFLFFTLCFIFHFTLYQLPSMGPIVFLSKYIHMRSSFEGFI